jgi:hypothetical protein
MAATHYDFTCQQAVSEADAPGRVNGFLTIAGFRTSMPPEWTFSEFDTCAKILEQRFYTQWLASLPMANALAAKMNAAMDSLNEEYKRLTQGDSK